LDSATAAAMAQADGLALYALTFRYGQRHAVEVDAARRVAEALSVEEHRVVDIDLRAFGGSALTDEIDVPKDRTDGEIGSGIPATYVPARNTIFLAYALAWAEVLGASDIVIGVNALDFSGYPDCRPEFLDAFQRLADLATRAGAEGGRRFRIRAPLVDLRKAEIIRQGLSLGIDYALTTSCYDPTAGEACGRCDACVLRLKGFAEVGAVDPVAYRHSTPSRA
jgi:7-cyano-7-deazaguanine synthase